MDERQRGANGEIDNDPRMREGRIIALQKSMNWSVYIRVVLDPCLGAWSMAMASSPSAALMSSAFFSCEARGPHTEQLVPISTRRYERMGYVVFDCNGSRVVGAFTVLPNGRHTPPAP